MNRYRHAMKIRGELEDLMHDDKVLGTMDIKYKRFIGKEIHMDDWMKLYDECTAIILEAFDKAEKYDSSEESKIDVVMSSQLGFEIGEEKKLNKEIR